MNRSGVSYLRKQLDLGRNRWLGIAGVGSSLSVAVGIVLSPLLTIGAALGLVALGNALLYASRLQRFWLKTLALLILGYVFLGRGFAHVGIPPLYLGELVLTLGLLAGLVGGGVGSFPHSPVPWLLVAFALHGASRTLPYIDTYQMVAFRDGVTWGYGLFALLVFAFLSRSQSVLSVPKLYGQLLPWLLFWLPFVILFQTVVGDYLPTLWGSTAALVDLEPPDIAVQLVGIASFLALGLHVLYRQKSDRAAWLKEWAWWAAWLLAALMVSSDQRTALLTIATGVGLVLMFQPMRIAKYGRAALLCSILIASLLLFNVEINTGVHGNGRKVSAEQIITNIKAIIGDTEGNEGNLEGSRQWRLDWWSYIIDYTFYGQYFWTGKGYGVNLAEVDGFQFDPTNRLRSPHNAHMTVLARSGVPGLALWVLLQSTFAASLIAAYFRARRSRQEMWARLDLWILSYWAAFMVSMSFEVSIESPHSAIPFWSLFGFGMAVLEAQRRRVMGPDYDLGRQPPAAVRLTG